MSVEPTSVFNVVGAIGADVEPIGVSLRELVVKCSLETDPRVLWYPDGSLVFSSDNQNFEGFGELFKMHQEHVRAFCGAHCRPFRSFQNRIGMWSHTDLFCACAEICAWGSGFAKRPDSYSIGFISQRRPVFEGHDTPLANLIVTVVWRRKLKPAACDPILLRAREFNLPPRNDGRWHPTGRIRKVVFFQNSLELHCDFEKASFHDFVWLVLCMTKAEPIQSCEWFSILEHETPNPLKIIELN